MIKIKIINSIFKKFGVIEIKYRFLFLALLTIITLLGIIGLKWAVFSSSRENWFFKKDPMTIATDNFEKEFGNNDSITLLVESENVFDPEVLTMIRNIGDELLANVPYSDDVTSLTEIEVSVGVEEGVDIINPIGDEIPDDPEKLEKIKNLILSKKAFRNKIVTEDSKETWIIISLLEFPEEKEWKKVTTKDPLFQVGEAALAIINNEKWKSDKYTIKAAGMPVTETEERDFFSKEMMIRVLSCFLAMIILLIIMARSFRGVIVPIFTTIAGIVVVFGTMGWFRIKIDNMLITLPILLGIALSVGYSIHLLNSFKNSFRKHGKRKEAVIEAIEHTGWPMFFTVITTVGSLLSFATVGIISIRWLGFACAAIVFVVYIYVIILIPILLSFGKDRKPETVVKLKNKKTLDFLFVNFGNLILKFKIPFIIFFIIVIIIFSIGIPFINVNIDIFDFMGLKVPYIKRVNEIVNSELGSYYSYNITIDFDEEDAAKDPENLKKFETLLEEVGQFELTKKNKEVYMVTSILDILKDMNQTLNEDNESFYVIPDNKLLVAQILLLYEMSGGSKILDWTNYDYSILRSRIDLKTFQAQELVKEREIIEQRAKELFPDAKLGLCGSAIQFAKLNMMIVFGEIRSFLTALIVISILLIIVFASIKTGLIGIIPNITPVIIIGGIMGIFNFKLDMMTMTIMPMLLGIAVDDTIHFINNIKYEFEITGNYKKAILNSFGYVGKTLAMTTLILSVAFAMYIPSPVNTLNHIGILAAAGLLSALVADYIMTPILVILTKPFGKESN